MSLVSNGTFNFHMNICQKFPAWTSQKVHLLIWTPPPNSQSECYKKPARGGIHEGPSRYRDYKADSCGPWTCSEDAVFVRAGQQGPLLSARVFLNHSLVIDRAWSFSTWCRSAFCLRSRQAVFLCIVLDGFVHQQVPDNVVQEAVKMVMSPSHWLMQHTFTALCSSSNLECISWRIGPMCLAKHMSLPTHTLSVSQCVCRGVCVRTSMSEREREFGQHEQLQVWSLFCFDFDFLGYKSHKVQCVLLQQTDFSRRPTFVVIVAEVWWEEILTTLLK